MYITASTYGGMDWHDSRTIYEQLKGSGSYDLCGRHPGKDPAGSLRKIQSPLYDQIRGKG